MYHTRPGCELWLRHNGHQAGYTEFYVSVNLQWDILCVSNREDMLPLLMMKRYTPALMLYLWFVNALVHIPNEDVVEIWQWIAKKMNWGGSRTILVVDYEVYMLLRDIKPDRIRAVMQMEKDDDKLLAAMRKEG